MVNNINSTGMANQIKTVDGKFYSGMTAADIKKSENDSKNTSIFTEFNKIDTNKDGILSAEEILANREEVANNMLGKTEGQNPRVVTEKASGGLLSGIAKAAAFSSPVGSIKNVFIKVTEDIKEKANQILAENNLYRTQLSQTDLVKEESKDKEVTENTEATNTKESKLSSGDDMNNSLMKIILKLIGMLENKEDKSTTKESDAEKSTTS